ncbi:hypothetical protein ACFPPD_03835 [Cohnella suwonensis]|uniref:t-SNARE coiled-coil homology domain-containing protein n=1 Tax=Cohnella suwonensis TaxID=696072 RepID=A0ABW0LTD7_9BACL
MSEERFDRLDNMMGQLIGMVGKVLAEQQDMKSDIKEINQRLERVETEQVRFNDSITYLLDKTAQHDHDIHVFKTRIFK